MFFYRTRTSLFGLGWSLFGKQSAGLNGVNAYGMDIKLALFSATISRISDGQDMF